MDLSTDRIVDGPSSSLEHLRCSICHEILWHPVTCETCEHSFCEACLNQWFQRQQQCPNTCKYRQRARPPHLLTQLLSSLKAVCKNTANGRTEIIPYEILGKHEQMCGYEINKCQGCLQPLLKQNVDRHELQCDHVEIFCNNCQITYRRRDGHEAVQCLRAQMKNENDLFEQKLTSVENEVRQQTELLHKIDQQQKALIERMDRQAGEAEDRESANCKNAFKPGQLCVAYSGLHLCHKLQGYGHSTEEPISISILDKDQTFNVESIEAFSITNDNSCQTLINGMRKNQTCFTRRIKLHNELQLFTLNWTKMDKLTIEVRYRENFEFAISQFIFTLS